MRLADRPDERGHVIVVAPARVDATNAHAFRLALHDALATRAPVIVDLSGVEQLHALGAAVLVGAVRRALDGGRSLDLREVSPAATHTLTSCGLGRWLPAAPRVPAA